MGIPGRKDLDYEEEEHLSGPDILMASITIMTKDTYRELHLPQHIKSDPSDFD